MRIARAGTDDLDTVRLLFRQYRSGVSGTACFQCFEKELADLPGFYAPPGGILLGFVDTEAVGCIAIRPDSRTGAELRRLFVRAPYRGRGLGAALLRAAMDDTRHAGYASLVLETLPDMHAAIALYRRHGFAPLPVLRRNGMPGIAGYRYRF